MACQCQSSRNCTTMTTSAPAIKFVVSYFQAASQSKSGIAVLETAVSFSQNLAKKNYKSTQKTCFFVFVFTVRLAVEGFADRCLTTWLPRHHDQRFVCLRILQNTPKTDLDAK